MNSGFQTFNHKIHKNFHSNIKTLFFSLFFVVVLFDQTTTNSIYFCPNHNTINKSAKPHTEEKN